MASSMASTSSTHNVRAARARDDQSRLPEAFSLEELGDWLPNIWEAAPRDDPLPNIYMAMDDLTRDVAYGLGQRQNLQQQGGIPPKPLWKRAMQPPKVKGLMRIPTMVQVWLPDGGRAQRWEPDTTRVHIIYQA